MQPARTEVSPEMLSVGHGRTRGKTVVGMVAFMRQFLPDYFVPEHATGFAVEAKYGKLMNLAGGSGPRTAVGRGCPCGLIGGCPGLGGRDGR